MTPLACFRFRASASEFLRYSLVLILLTLLMGIIARSDDQDGDGYDDETGEWIGDYSDPSYDPDPGSGDGDGDGLTDEEEILYYGTDPNAADTDDDGLRDAEEIFGVETFREEQYYSYTDYYYDDETGDYVYYDVYETYTTSTTVYPDPRDADTDRDLLPDGHEVGLGLDPTDPADGFGDVDGDGLGRGEEYLIGTRHDRTDTDGDGIGDGAEIAAGSDPLDPASPGSPGDDPDPESSDPSGGAGGDPEESNGDPPLEENGSTGGGDGDGAGDGGAGDDGGASGPGDQPPSPESDGDGSTGSPPAEPAPLDPRVHFLDVEGKIAVLPEALWRAVYGFAIGDSGVDSADTDGDGLTNHAERLRGTHPRVADTDGDGLSDGEEISGYAVGEGYWSWEEVWADYFDDSTGESYSYSTTEHVWVPAGTATSDPLRRDSNGNGRDDGADRLLDGYRHDSGGTPDEYTDDDGDLLMLYEESDIGTNPWEADSDGDGLSDSQEQWGFERTVETVREETRYVTEERYDEQTGETYYEEVPYQETITDYATSWTSTNPANPDTDGDGLPDGHEVSLHLDPTDPSDGLVDGDGDGLDRGEEFALGTSDSVPNGDLDGDGIADLREVHEHSPPLRALGYPGFDAADPTDGAADYDHDGATNREEDAAGTGLLDPDTDDDGILDGAELAAGTDPLVSDGPPAGEGTGEGDGNESTGETGDGTGSDNPGDETGSGTEGDPTDTGGTTPDTDGTNPDTGVGGTGGSGGGSGGGSTTNPGQGDPDAATGPDSGDPPNGQGEQPEPLLLSGLKGRTHRTAGGHGSVGEEGGGADPTPFTVQVADRFTAELVRNQFDAEGNQTEEEERTRVSGPADSLEDARQEWERDYWTAESITYTYRTETIVTEGDVIEATPPSGSEFYVEGPVVADNSTQNVETLAEEEEIAGIYEAISNDPNGDYFWEGSVGSMGFTAPGWKQGDRINFGAVPYREPVDGTSYATFVTGVVPMVAWTEYWMQAEGPLPEGQRETRTFMVHATQQTSGDDSSDDEFQEWFGTVAFEIEPEEEVSTEAPEVKWTTPGAPSGWIEARDNGTLLVKPPCERGEDNRVSLIPIEFEFVEILPNGEIGDVIDPELSFPSPVIDVTHLDVEPEFAVDAEGNAVLRATLSLAGTIDDALADITPGSAGRVHDHLYVIVNEAAESHAVEITHQKQSTGRLGWKQFDYTGSFDAQIQIEVTEGINTIRLLSIGKSGEEGYSLHTVEIEVSGDEGEGTAIEMHFADQPSAAVEDTATVDLGDGVPVFLSESAPESFAFSGASAAGDPVSVEITALSMEAWLNGFGESLEASVFVGGTATYHVLEPAEVGGLRFVSRFGVGVAATPSVSATEPVFVRRSEPGPFQPFVTRLKNGKNLPFRAANRPPPPGGHPGKMGTLETVFPEAKEFPTSPEADWPQPTAETRTWISYEEGGADPDDLYLANAEGTLPDLGIGTKTWGDIFRSRSASNAVDQLMEDWKPKTIGAGAVKGFLYSGVDLLMSGVRITDWTIAKAATYAEFVVKGDDGSLKAQFEADLSAVIGGTIAAGKLLANIGELMAQGNADQANLIIAMLTGDHATAKEIGGKYERAYYLAAEVLAYAAEEVKMLDEGEQGIIMGALVFEIIMMLIPGGQVKHVTKVKMLDDLAVGKFAASTPGGKVMAKTLLLVEEMRTTKMCFVAGTLVMTAQGALPIEAVRPGTEVWARDEFTKVEGWKPVLQTFTTHPEELFTLSYDTDGDGLADEELTGTGEHPFWVEEFGAFLPMRDLRSGMRLSLAHDGGTAIVTGNASKRGPPGERFTTFNFEVEDFHTYFVGEAGVWVHNTGGAHCEKAFALWTRLMERNGGKHWDAMNSLFTRLPKQADKFLEMLQLRQAVFKDVLKAKYPNGARVWSSQHPWKNGWERESIYSLKASGFSGELDFIVTKSGELRVGESHSFLARSDEVISAGQVTFRDGKIVGMTNGSGHYIPKGVDPGIPEGAWLSHGFDEAIGRYNEVWTWK